MTMKIYPSFPGLTYPVVRMGVFDTLVTAAPNKYEVGLPQTVNPQWSWQLVYDLLRDKPGITFGVGELRTLVDFFLYQNGQAGRFLYLDPDDNYVGPALISAAPNVPLAQLQLVNDGLGNYYSPLQRTLGGLFYEDITDLNTDTGAGGSALAVYLNGTLATAGSGANQYALLGPGLAVSGSSFMGLYLKWGPGAPAWAAAHAYALNATILDAAGHIQKATTAGTSGSTIPTFNDAGSTTPDGAGTLIWTDQGYYAGPAAPVTAQFNFYFRVKFESDSQDLEKFSNQFWTVGGSQSQKGSGQIKLMQARPVAL
jgi:hypothetical protein